jgi:hypothetical protein
MKTATLASKEFLYDENGKKIQVIRVSNTTAILVVLVLGVFFFSLFAFILPGINEKQRQNVANQESKAIENSFRSMAKEQDHLTDKFRHVSEEWNQINKNPHR